MSNACVRIIGTFLCTYVRTYVWTLLTTPTLRSNLTNCVNTLTTTTTDGWEDDYCCSCCCLCRRRLLLRPLTNRKTFKSCISLHSFGLQSTTLSVGRRQQRQRLRQGLSVTITMEQSARIRREPDKWTSRQADIQTDRRTNACMCIHTFDSFWHMAVHKVYLTPTNKCVQKIIKCVFFPCLRFVFIMSSVRAGNS